MLFNFRLVFCAKLGGIFFWLWWRTVGIEEVNQIEIPPSPYGGATKAASASPSLHVNCNPRFTIHRRCAGRLTDDCDGHGKANLKQFHYSFLCFFCCCCREKCIKIPKNIHWRLLSFPPFDFVQMSFCNLNWQFCCSFIHSFRFLGC